MGLACVNDRLLTDDTWNELTQIRASANRTLNEFDNRANVFYLNFRLASIVELIETDMDPRCQASVERAHLALDALVEELGF